MTSIPPKFCECGCGTPLNRRKKPTKEMVIKHFWNKVPKSGPDDCWEWKYGCKSTGYGQFISQLFPEYRTAHRFMYFLTHGPIPKGVLICHKCDNRPCVNPNHLFAGSYSDNTIDMYKKRRGVRTKLTDEQKAEIKASYVFWKNSYPKLARKYHVSMTTIRRIVLNLNKSDR